MLNVEKEEDVLVDLMGGMGTPSTPPSDLILDGMDDLGVDK